MLGVSLDTVESHKSFCTKDNLTFKLLADPDHKVIDQYGVPVKNFGVAKFANRETFLISPDGKIVKDMGRQGHPQPQRTRSSPPSRKAAK